MTKQDFFDRYVNRIVNVVDRKAVKKVHFFPIAESSKVRDAKALGYSIASVYWKWNEEDSIIIDNDVFTTPHKVGYFVLIGS